MRLEVWPRTELTLRAIAVLADGGRRRAAEIAEQVDSTVQYMAQVLAPLIHAGWLHSVPGRAGGYELVADLRALSVLDLVEVVEGPTDPDRCVMANRPCPAPVPCALHDAWLPARDALVGRLRDTSLASVISQLEEPR